MPRDQLVHPAQQVGAAGPIQSQVEATVCNNAANESLVSDIRCGDSRFSAGAAGSEHAGCLGYRAFMIEPVERLPQRDRTAFLGRPKQRTSMRLVNERPVVVSCGYPASSG